MQQNHLAQVSSRLRSSSAVVPALILTLICTPSGLIAANFAVWPISSVLMVFAFLPPALAFFQILLFTFFDRDRLHNEDHVERKMIISRGIGDANGMVSPNPSTPLISNPSLDGGLDAQ
jgi:hypothetical protein